MKRREFLKASGALGLGALLPAPLLASVPLSPVASELNGGYIALRVTTFTHYGVMPEVLRWEPEGTIGTEPANGTEGKEV